MFNRYLQFAVVMAAFNPAPALSQSADPIMESVRPQYERVKQYLLSAAQQMSEDDLAFSPTSGVRSGLAMFAHIADSQHYFCSAALGESTPHETEIERSVSTKEALIAELRASFAYCDQAYAQSDAEALSPLQAFGGRG